jgi:hypothetical protein
VGHQNVSIYQHDSDKRKCYGMSAQQRQVKTFEYNSITAARENT